MKSKILANLQKDKEHFPCNIFGHVFLLVKNYLQIAEKKCIPEEEVETTLSLYVSLIKKEVKSPTKFSNFHLREKTPVDYYQLAKDIFSPFVDKENSTIKGKANLEKIKEYIDANENVILLSNHQAEPDPTILSILLEDCSSELVDNMISIAGARVTTDPVTVPLTKGQNVICVYSKKYFGLHPEQEKQMKQHNSTSMIALRHVLNKGGACIYVAPSGGRDRIDEHGILSPALFDPESIELMRIVGKGNKTHYFPLALYTYPILPAPKRIKKEIGEERIISHSAVHINFGEEYKMLAPPSKVKEVKIPFRKKQATTIHNIVKKLYDEVTNKIKEH